MTGAPLDQAVVSFFLGCGLSMRAAEEISADAMASIGARPDNDEITTFLLSLIKRYVPDEHPVTYVSLPITTGRAYLEWRAGLTAGGQTACTTSEAVRAANRRRAERGVERLRRTLPGLLIDPSQLSDIPEWRQPDYHGFWTRLIAEYVDTIVFLDGWQYSVGCTVEFAEAIRLGLPTRTELLDPLPVPAGLDLVEDALREYDAAGVEPAGLRDAWQSARSFATPAEKPKS
jgi:hypothetical protein